MKQKKTQPMDWLPATKEEETFERKLEHKLISLQDSLKKEIADQEELKARADDTEKHGEYRYHEGVIAGLNQAIGIIGDRLMDLWDM
jgi:hypothetical protein